MGQRRDEVLQRIAHFAASGVGQLGKDGFLMMQESVYCKLAVNAVSADLIKQRVNRIKPAKGVIQLMIITEKQYSQIDYLLGGPQEKQLDTTERLWFF